MKYTVVLLAVISALFCRAFFVSVYKVSSNTMAPNIIAGDFILASQIAYRFKLPGGLNLYNLSPERGDLVVYLKDSKVFIKRILAVENESVEYINNEILINSKKCEYRDSRAMLDAEYTSVIEKCEASSQLVIKSTELSKSASSSPIHLQKSQFFVVNDNRFVESDKNFTDIINYDQIIGKPVLIWMSYSSTQDFISNTTGIRWNRILTNPR